jgi:hypothetical protein
MADLLFSAALSLERHHDITFFYCSGSAVKFQFRRLLQMIAGLNVGVLQFVAHYLG